MHIQKSSGWAMILRLRLGGSYSGLSGSSHCLFIFVQLFLQGAQGSVYDFSLLQSCEVD